MASNVVNTVPFLQTSRDFPEDLSQLCVEVNRSYVDIANAVNNRTISIFPTSRPAINGEDWFINSNKRQQGFRQVYTFGTLAAGATISIPTGIKFINNITMTRLFGTVFTTLPDYRPIPYVSATVITEQISIRLDITTNSIVIVNGATAQPITSGLVVLEWISSP